MAVGLFSAVNLDRFRQEQRKRQQNIATPESVTDPRERAAIAAEADKLPIRFFATARAQDIRQRAALGQFRSAIPGPQSVDLGVLRERRNRAARRAAAGRGGPATSINLLGGGSTTQPSLLGL